MKNKSSRSGDLLVILGLLLMLSAAVIFTSNTFDSRRSSSLSRSEVMHRTKAAVTKQNCSRYRLPR